MTHPFVPRPDTCARCGMPAKDHQWACAKHNTAGYGYGCPECRIERELDEMEGIRN